MDFIDRIQILLPDAQYFTMPAQEMISPSFICKIWST